MPIDEIGGLPKPTITNYPKKVAPPTTAAPKTGPAQPPPPQPSGTGPWGGFGQGGVISTAPWGGFGQGGIPAAQPPAAQPVVSVQQVLASQTSRAWDALLAWNEQRDYLKAIALRQANYVALWSAVNTPAPPSLSGGGSGGGSAGYGGFGNNSDPRGYALAMGLYNW